RHRNHGRRRPGPGIGPALGIAAGRQAQPARGRRRQGGMLPVETTRVILIVVARRAEPRKRPGWSAGPPACHNPAPYGARLAAIRSSARREMCQTPPRAVYHDSIMKTELISIGSELTSG